LELTARIGMHDEEFAKRIKSEEYQSLLRKAFRDWAGTESEEKRILVRSLLSNAAGASLVSDDVVKLTMKSAFDEDDAYELTALGEKFVHYAMTDVAPKIEGKSQKHEVNTAGHQRTQQVEAIRLAYHALELDPRFGTVAALAGLCHSTNVIVGHAVDPQSEHKEAVRRLRLALSLDDGNPETSARAALISAYMAGDSESEIEMADRAVALNPNSFHAWSCRAELRGSRRRQTGALKVPFARAR